MVAAKLKPALAHHAATSTQVIVGKSAPAAVPAAVQSFVRTIGQRAWREDPVLWRRIRDPYLLASAASDRSIPGSVLAVSCARVEVLAG
jgi:hypothetical protein